MKTFLTIIFFFLFTHVFPAIYYVKNTGNDLNTGLCDEQAFANHPWMRTFTGTCILQPGDSVLLKRGDIWIYSGVNDKFLVVGNDGTEGNYIYTGAYGVGDKPILYRNQPLVGSTVIYGGGRSFIIFDNLDIKQYSGIYDGSGSSGITMYEHDAEKPCHDWIITNCDVHDVPQYCIYSGHDSYNITIGDTTATATATETKYSNQLYNFGYGGIMLCGTNPATLRSNFKVYFNYVHSATRKTVGDNEYGIHFTVQNNSKSHPAYTYIRYNYVRDILTWKSIGDHGGSYLYIQDNHILNFGKAGIGKIGRIIHTIPIIDHHIWVERNLVEIDPDSLRIGTQGSFINISSDSYSVPAKNVYVRDNICQYTKRPTASHIISQIPIHIENADSVFVSGNEIYNGSIAPSALAGIYTSATVSNIFIDANFIKDWYYAISLYGSSVNGKVQITNNICIKSGINFANTPLAPTAYIEIYHNTFRDFYTREGTLAGSKVFIKNNLIGDPLRLTNNYFYSMGSASVKGTFIFDYNVYAKVNFAKPIWFSGKTYSLTEWQTIGNDTNSTEESDLKFTRSVNDIKFPADLLFDYDSPLYDAGTKTGIKYDFYSLRRIYAPDVGSIEYR